MIFKPAVHMTINQAGSEILSSRGNFIYQGNRNETAMSNPWNKSDNI